VSWAQRIGLSWGEKLLRGGKEEGGGKRNKKGHGANFGRTGEN